MKKILVSFLVLCLSVSTFAQQPGQSQGNRPDPETQSKELTKRMKEIIQFSDEQEKQVYDLNLEYAKKRRELFQNRTEDREAMREKMQAMNKEYDTALKNILSEQQFKKYLEEKETIRQRPPREGENSRPGNRGGRN